MKYHFKPIAAEPGINLDGYTKREGYLGPIRQNGIVYYYDPLKGKLYNPKTRQYENA
jgi:hypothetical protein